jgi:hypothetical protein
MLMLLGGAVLVLAAGCGVHTTKFFIDDHRGGVPAARYYEEFPECYYSLDAHNHVDIVARRQSRGDRPDSPPVVQVVHIRRVWAAVPGQTLAEQSMINATVSYFIVGPEGGASFEGGGFVTFEENREETGIAGQLESSSLTPQRQAGLGSDLFERISVTGTFQATRDKRRVVRLLNETRRLFGPMPRYEPPPSPDLR